MEVDAYGVSLVFEVKVKSFAIDGAKHKTTPDKYYVFKTKKNTLFLATDYKKIEAVIQNVNDWLYIYREKSSFGLKGSRKYKIMESPYFSMEIFMNTTYDQYGNLKIWYTYKDSYREGKTEQTILLNPLQVLALKKLQTGKL